MLRMLLCSGAMKIMRMVYPIHFRLIPSALGKAETWVSGGERQRLMLSLVVPFSPLSVMLYFSYPQYSSRDCFSRIQHHHIPVRKKSWGINIMSGAQNSSSNRFNLLWKQRILPIEFNLWQSKRGFLAK